MRHLLKLSIPAVAISLLLAACGSSSSSNTTSSAASAQPAAHTSTSASSTVVKTASNPALGTILVNSQGMTLYHLSGEQGGKFICTSSACVGIWHPLTVASGSTPSGEGVTLGTVKRPDGTTQATYQGTPLYTFVQDQQPGETKGQGIKDVGTWSVVTTGSASSASSTSGSGGSTPSTSSTPAAPAESGGGSGGGSSSGYGY
ncbi:MAG: COG4315 family predicted lipoprotein [Solirubrobacteraceae bacterium]